MAEELKLKAEGSVRKFLEATGLDEEGIEAIEERFTYQAQKAFQQQQPAPSKMDMARKARIINPQKDPAPSKMEMARQARIIK